MNMTHCFKQLLLLLIFINICFCSNRTFKDCNFTDFRFQSKYNLGKQDQLNKTFQLMQNKTKLQDIIYSTNSWTQYNISGINPNFRYYDSKQKAEIMNNDTIIIDGSAVEAKFEMKWIRKDFLFTEGIVQVKCKSDQILFSKKLYIDKGFVLYHLEDYYNVTFKQNQCVIQRYQPANTLQTDLDIIKMMLNQLPNNKPTVKSQLQAQIAKKYSFYLNNSLYNDKHQLDDHMIYQYKYPNSNHTFPIQYQIVPTGVHLNKQGISFNFVTQIKDMEDWTCGASIPYQNKNIKQFGGLQQFISLSVFQNTLKYGIQQGLINTDLNRQNWQSNTFQFFAGDLYQIIPYIAKNFAAREQIIGNCRALSDNVSIKAEEMLNELFVKTTHNCELYIRKNNKILDFAVRLTSHVQTKFQEQAKVNFYIKSVDFDVSYYEKPNYKIINYDWSNFLLRNSLNILKGMKLFGSGWPIFDMDYPHFKVMSEGYAFFYDTSMVGSYDQ